jgi:hypothetical protein
MHTHWRTVLHKNNLTPVHIVINFKFIVDICSVYSVFKLTCLGTLSLVVLKACDCRPIV